VSLIASTRRASPENRRAKQEERKDPKKPEIHDVKRVWCGRSVNDTKGGGKYRCVFQSMANSAPAEQVIAQVTIGDRSATLPDAPLVCETLLSGSDCVSALASEGSDEVAGDVTNAGGSLFCGVSGGLGGLDRAPSGIAEATGAAGAVIEAVGSVCGLLSSAALH